LRGIPIIIGTPKQSVFQCNAKRVPVRILF
jgi:hypothetical protein